MSGSNGGVETFAVGDRVTFNKRGQEAQVSIPNDSDLLGCTCWPVEDVLEVPPGNIHPQRLTLGPGYPIGPVSGAFVTKCGVADCRRKTES